MDPKADELAARREARKRKILENAKNRIGRLTGRENDTAENGKSAQAIVIYVRAVNLISIAISFAQRTHSRMHRMRVTISRAHEKELFTRIQKLNVTSMLSQAHSLRNRSLRRMHVQRATKKKSLCK